MLRDTALSRVTLAVCHVVSSYAPFPFHSSIVKRRRWIKMSQRMLSDTAEIVVAGASKFFLL